MIYVMFNMVLVEFVLKDVVGGDVLFCFIGIIVIDLGFFVVYEEGCDQKVVEDEDEGWCLLWLVVGEVVLLYDILVEQYFIELLLCFFEVSLVKVLEEYGIGCFLIYVSIIQVLFNCEYVLFDVWCFKLIDVGCVVGKFLVQYFICYVDYDFIVKFEDEFDVVSCGEEVWVLLMECFWQLFKQQVDEKIELVDCSEVIGVCELGVDLKSGKLVLVCLGCYGLYVQIGDKDIDEKLQFVSLCLGQSMYMIMLDQVIELFKLLCKFGQVENGDEVSVGVGCFGLFVKQGSIYVLFKFEDDLYIIELLCVLQIVVEKLEMFVNCVIKDFGNGVQVFNGCYGVYIIDGEKNVCIFKDVELKDFIEVQCVELFVVVLVKKGCFVKKIVVIKKVVVKKELVVKKVVFKKVVVKKSVVKKIVVKKIVIKKIVIKKVVVKKVVVCFGEV